ncbi:hypothetical protein SteCoe_20531 [Stentor coeruleus]|uniref:GYF domain-containing protein n=1 Tax=Stentor coeruleus TaxID=5963 RepID=A0A1R2BRP8_9CILI|nr:hypothetical protein SteCoe_20531 [Stentor coeruleus]
MAERPKAMFKKDWRKAETNLSSYRYTREEILKLYSSSQVPENFNPPVELFSYPSQNPSNSQKPLFTCSSSRWNNSLKESIPEWYNETIEEQKTSINADEIEEEYSKIDVKYEDSIKNIIEEDDKYPEWDDPHEENNEEINSPEIIAYPLSLIEKFVNEGNPFACIIMANSISNEDSVITNPYSIPFEKVWYYKDPQGNVQGPFTTLDMFNWSAAGYFSSNLQIAHSSPTHFFSLQMYILQEKYKSLSNSIEKKS